MTPGIDKIILPKNKYKERKNRYTFPNELDDKYICKVKHKRRHSTKYNIEQMYDFYDEQHITITKTGDCEKQEIVTKKYSKVHPFDEDDFAETPAEKDDSLVKVPTTFGILSSFFLNIFVYIWIF